MIGETGLKGRYTFQLHYAPDLNLVDEPSRFTALQEQLGLMLKTDKRTVEVLVVDRAEKPAPNGRGRRFRLPLGP